MALIGPGGRPVTSEPAQGASGTSPHVKDSGLATFAADVLDASRATPVIVDFWAPCAAPARPWVRSWRPPSMPRTAR
jgi:putative thioredoxin